MVQTMNVPIQMISCCSTLGDFTPMKFRFENEVHEILTVVIADILGRKEIGLSGNKEIHFTCTAEIERQTKMFILVYNINSHRWKLFQMLT